jgi:hypothetical protein
VAWLIWQARPLARGLVLACKNFTHRQPKPRRFEMKKAKTPSSVKTTEISLSDPPFDCEEYAYKLPEEVPERLKTIVEHEKGYFAYLHIPNIYFYKEPQEWEINLKYKDETVKITGGPDKIHCGNLEEEQGTTLNSLLKVFVTNFRQPEK